MDFSILFIAFSSDYVAFSLQNVHLELSKERFKNVAMVPKLTASVFFSHSKHDIDIVNYFSNIFTDIGLQGMFYEWQRQYTNYAGQTITNIILHPDTLAVFVLLGKKLQNPPTRSPEYTHNWVSFEVGIASASRKPIWVFEEFGSFIRFPIPFVTDYAQYTLANLEHLQYYGTIFQDRIMSQTNLHSPLRCFRCEYNDCNAIYNIWSVAERFNCPVCRRPIPKGTQGFVRPLHFPSNVI